MPLCLSSPSHNGYLVHRSKDNSIVAVHPLPGEVKCLSVSEQHYPRSYEGNVMNFYGGVRGCTMN